MARAQAFSTLLSGYRCAAGLTQRELAVRAGLSVDAISLLERGARRPRPATITAIAEALGLGPGDSSVLAAAGANGVHRQAAPAGQGALRIPPDLCLPLTPFMGRERDAAQVRALLERADVRLLTLTGSPGAGKTRLALQVAPSLTARYPGGVIVLALEHLREPAAVVPMIRQALELREVDGPSDLDTVMKHSGAPRLLLVLDNFEHLLPAGRELMMLLQQCPGLQALVTSRAALRVRAEHEFMVLPLELPGGRGPEALRGNPSVAMFVERARAVSPEFELTRQNANAVAAICERLDGVPLALELAAPWIKVLRPEMLLERLDTQLTLLVDGPRDLPDRQRTMRATLAWSAALLPPGSLAVLRRLSIFAGSAPLDALEQVCLAAGALEGGVLVHLSTLVNHCLALRLEAVSIEPRMRVLESVRQFGAELLTAAGEYHLTARAHLEHYLGLADRARIGARGQAGASWLERLRRERDNFRAALQWALAHEAAEPGLRLAGTLWPLWSDCGHRQEGLRWLEQLLAVEAAVDLAVRAEALHMAGFLAGGLGDYELASRRQRESLAAYRELGDPAGVADALRGVGQAIGRQGNLRHAIPLLERAAALLRQLDNPRLLAATLVDLGDYASRLGDAGRSVALYEKALALHRDLGDQLGVATCLINLAERDRRDGRLDLARERLEEGLSIACSFGVPFHLAIALLGLGNLARTRGDASEAGAWFLQALAPCALINDPHFTAACLRGLAWVELVRGRCVKAAQLLGAAHALWPHTLAPDRDERPFHDRVRAELRVRLGGGLFDVSFEVGASLSLRQAAAVVCDPDGGWPEAPA